MKNLNDLHMDARPFSAMVSVSWKMDNGDRMHVWLQVQSDKDSGQSKPVSPYAVKIDRPMGHKTSKAVLYRNPAINPDGSHKRRGDHGYFETRYLDASANINAELVAEALRRAETEGMFDQALQTHERREREGEAVRRAEKAAKIREQLTDRRNKLVGVNRPQLRNLLDAVLASSDDDILEFCHLG